jgi:hypothetical protein
MVARDMLRQKPSRMAGSTWPLGTRHLDRLNNIVKNASLDAQVVEFLADGCDLLIGLKEVNLVVLPAPVLPFGQDPLTPDSYIATAAPAS